MPERGVTHGADGASGFRRHDDAMRRTRARTTRRRTAFRRHGDPSVPDIGKMLRPIVRELVAEELERLEDRLDAQDAREALSEPGGITHEELVKRLGS